MIFLLFRNVVATFEVYCNFFQLNLDSPTLARFSFLTSLIGGQVRCLDGVAAKLSEVGKGEYTVATLAEELKDDVGSELVKR